MSLSKTIKNVSLIGSGFLIGMACACGMGYILMKKEKEEKTESGFGFDNKEPDNPPFNSFGHQGFGEHSFNSAPFGVNRSYGAGFGHYPNAFGNPMNTGFTGDFSDDFSFRHSDMNEANRKFGETINKYKDLDNSSKKCEGCPVLNYK